jgi:hypothetical protein
MKAIVVTAVLLAAIAVWVAVRMRSRQHLQALEDTTVRSSDGDGAGQGLRRMMLTTAPSATGTTPTPEFPRVYGILMDMPIANNHTATVFSTSSGAASLYTTSSFGILGGEGHETVRLAAKNFVRAADEFFDAAIPTIEYPYPAAGRIRFYLLTFEGVRVVDTDLASLSNGTGQYYELFGLGQAVLTELRLVTPGLQ